MDTQPPQPGESGSESSRLVGATSNRSLIGTQHKCGYELVHREVANAATKFLTKDAQKNRP